MRAVQFFDYGSADVLQLVEVPQPEPGEGQVRVKVVAAGISPADYKWRTGMFREMVPLTMRKLMHECPDRSCGIWGAPRLAM